MKLSLTHHEIKYSMQTPGEDVTLEEVVEAFRGLLVSAGYHPQAVNQHFDISYDWNFTKPDDCCSRATESSLESRVEQYQNEMYK